MNTNSWSLGILCYNEEENIENTIKKANAVLEKLQQPYEILIIDDGSSDKSKEVIAKTIANIPCLSGRRISRNLRAYSPHIVRLAKFVTKVRM